MDHASQIQLPAGRGEKGRHGLSIPRAGGGGDREPGARRSSRSRIRRTLPPEWCLTARHPQCKDGPISAHIPARPTGRFFGLRHRGPRPPAGPDGEVAVVPPEAPSDELHLPGDRTGRRHDLSSKREATPGDRVAADRTARDDRGGRLMGHRGNPSPEQVRERPWKRGGPRRGRGSSISVPVIRLTVIPTTDTGAGPFPGQKPRSEKDSK